LRACSQPDYSQDAVDLAYVLPSDAGGSWYVGFAHNGPSVCDLNLTAWVERTWRLSPFAPLVLGPFMCARTH
jgi:hypothetical protein